MAVSTVQKFLDQISKNREVKNFVSEFNKLSGELKKRGKELNTRMANEGGKTLQQAHDKVLQAVKATGITQKQLDAEIEAYVARIRRSAADLEKGLEFYGKQAMAQKARLEKAIAARRAGAKKTSKKATSKKTAAGGAKKVRRSAKKA